MLQASVPLKEPQEIEVVEVLPDKGKVGKGFKRDAAIVFKHFAELDNAGAQALGDALEAEGKTTLTIDGKDFVVTKDMVKVEKKTKRIHGWAVERKNEDAMLSICSTHTFTLSTFQTASLRLVSLSRRLVSAASSTAFSSMCTTSARTTPSAA